MLICSCVYVYLCVEMCRMSKSLCPLFVLLISQIKSYHAQLPPDSSLFHLPYYFVFFVRQYVPFYHHAKLSINIFSISKTVAHARVSVNDSTSHPIEFNVPQLINMFQGMFYQNTKNIPFTFHHLSKAQIEVLEQYDIAFLIPTRIVKAK